MQFPGLLKKSLLHGYTTKTALEDISTKYTRDEIWTPILDRHACAIKYTSLGESVDWHTPYAGNMHLGT